MREESQVRSAPPGEGDRVLFVDQVRGFALFGMLFVNALTFAQPTAYWIPPSTWLDLIASQLTSTLFLAKAYLLFAFLFGYSTVRFFRIHEPEGRRSFRWRLVALGCLGIAHAWFLFHWDVLLGLSILGFGLLWLIRAPDRRRIQIALGIIGAQTLLSITLFVSVFVMPDEMSHNPLLTAFDEAAERGTFWDVVLARITIWPETQLALLLMNHGLAFAAILLGSVAAERRMLEELNPQLLIWKWGRSWGFPIGLMMSIAFAQGDPYRWNIPTFAMAPLLSWGYLSWLVWFGARKARGLALFQETGRMSLTCYLAESMMLGAVFYAWGLGVFGTTRDFGAAMIAVGIAIVLELFARLWRRRFLRGPVESLVASLLGLKRRWVP